MRRIIEVAESERETFGHSEAFASADLAYRQEGDKYQIIKCRYGYHIDIGDGLVDKATLDRLIAETESQNKPTRPQLWSDEWIDETVRDMPIPMSCDISVVGQMRIIRDDYEIQLDEYRERAEKSPGIVSQLELEKWKLESQNAQLKAEIATLNAYIDDLESTTDETKLNERITELEGHLAERIELATQ